MRTLHPRHNVRTFVFRCHSLVVSYAAYSSSSRANLDRLAPNCTRQLRGASDLGRPWNETGCRNRNPAMLDTSVSDNLADVCTGKGVENLPATLCYSGRIQRISWDAILRVLVWQVVRSLISSLPRTPSFCFARVSLNASNSCVGESLTAAVIIQWCVIYEVLVYRWSEWSKTNLF